jgi:hypothetical protein
MKTKLARAFVVLAGLSLFALPGSAHHGSSAYDFTKLITMKATVTGLEWGNPHCILKFDARDDKGVVKQWSLEMYNPLWMSRAGWSKETLKPGDEIEVTFHPAKVADGNGFIRIPESKIVLRGQSLNMDENGPGTGTSSPAN